jgi:hypothetical protein
MVAENASQATVTDWLTAVLDVAVRVIEMFWALCDVHSSVVELESTVHVRLTDPVPVAVTPPSVPLADVTVHAASTNAAAASNEERFSQPMKAIQVDEFESIVRYLFE